jgi:hypothetical protein
MNAEVRDSMMISFPRTTGDDEGTICLRLKHLRTFRVDLHSNLKRCQILSLMTTPWWRYVPPNVSWFTLKRKSWTSR